MLCCTSLPNKNEEVINFSLAFVEMDSHTDFNEVFGVPLLKERCYESAAKTHN